MYGSFVATALILSAFQLDVQAETWEEMSTATNNIDVAANSGKAYRVNNWGKVYEHTGGQSWTSISGIRFARKICADDNGVPWVAARDGKVYYRRDGSWIAMHPDQTIDAVEVGCGSDAVYVLGEYGHVYVLRRSSWQKISGLLSYVSVNELALPWGVNWEGKVFYGYDGLGGWLDLQDYDLDGNEYFATDTIANRASPLSIERSTGDIHWLHDIHPIYIWIEYSADAPDDVHKMDYDGSRSEIWIVTAGGKVYRYNES